LHRGRIQWSDRHHLGTGTCNITASRAGDANYNASAPSAAVSINIHQALTTASVISSPEPVCLRAIGDLYRDRLEHGGYPDGYRQLPGRSRHAGAVALNGSGQATFPTLLLVAGNHSITAVYGGDSNFAASVSAPIGQTCSRPTPRPV
jgi:hypothetical protein